MKPTAYFVFAIGIVLYLLHSPAGLGQPLAGTDLNPIQDPALQKSLNDIIDSNGWRGMAENRRLAVTLVALDDNDLYRLAKINGHQMLYAASMSKIAILFAAMVAAQEGDLRIDPGLDEDLHNMIRVSCNPCATRVMQRVGRDQLLHILQRPQYGFYNRNLYGGLWVGKDYAGRPAHRRDPLKGLSHGATTYQVARLYYRLVTDTLLQPEYTRRMLDYLARPAISHKFVKALEGEDGVQLWRKSGTWKQFHGDSVLVQSPAGRYILVALVEGAEGEQVLQQLAREVHRLVGGP